MVRAACTFRYVCLATENLLPSILAVRTAVSRSGAKVDWRFEVLAYATKPDGIAADGDGRDSPYTEALVESFRKPTLGLFDAFNDAALILKRKNGGCSATMDSRLRDRGQMLLRRLHQLNCAD